MRGPFDHLFRAVVCASAIVVVACGGGSNQTQQNTAQPQGAAAPPPSSGAAAPATPVDPATAGTVTGKVTFTGTPAAAQPVKLGSDPYCEKANPGLKTESEVVGSDGSLGNVFVYVKDGLGNRTFPAPSDPVILDQKGCHYTPHVLGIQIGQPLQIVNSDDTLHNIHAHPTANKEFNQGQPIQGMKMTHTFSTKEVMVPFKCDVHGWMNAWVGVLDHPYYAVTSTDGTFSLKGLPPGTYTIEAWHEKLGTQTQTVTVGAKETKNVAFSFKA
jgi:plastocyanin